MARSRKAEAEDAAHRRRLQQLRPKARFKELSKRDQRIVIAATLSEQLRTLRSSHGGMSTRFANGYQITVREIHPRYISKDPTTGLLTKQSAAKIKRSVAGVFKAVLGHDAEFMFTIEQQDRVGI